MNNMNKKNEKTVEKIQKIFLNINEKCICVNLYLFFFYHLQTPGIDKQETSPILEVTPLKSAVYINVKYIHIREDPH